MPIYHTAYKAKPLPGCEMEGFAKGVIAKIWIKADSPGQAHRLAEDYLKNHRWQPVRREETAAQYTGEPQTHLQTEAFHLQAAQARGVSVEWFGWSDESA